MHHFRAIALLIFFPIAIFLIPKLPAIKNSILWMPLEYKVLQKTFEELASANNFGSRPIRLTIVSGYGAAYRAEGLTNCSKKQNNCSFYRDLNPFKKYYDPELTELIRQSDLTSGYQGFVDTAAGGLISIVRSSFYLSEFNNEELSCVLAHELSHAINEEPFAQRLALWKINETEDDAELDEIDLEIRRESELAADQDATLFLWRAGYPLNTCLRFRERLLKAHWYRLSTDPQSSYFGYDEWMTRLRMFVEENKKLERPTNLVGTKGSWKYDRRLNLLTFIPTQNYYYENPTPGEILLS